MRRHLWRWLALLSLVGSVASLLIPISYGQDAQWVVTVGAGDPETVSVGAHAVPVRLIVEGTDPLPTGLTTRLVAAAFLVIAALVASVLWWRSPIE